MSPIDFTGTQRSASEFFYFAKRGIPNKIKKIHQFEDLDSINDKKVLITHHYIEKPKLNVMFADPKQAPCITYEQI